MEYTENVWQLVARVLNGEASASEQEELLMILHEDETLQQHYDLLSRIWKEKDGHADLHDKEAARNAIARIINKANDKPENKVKVKALIKKAQVKAEPEDYVPEMPNERRRLVRRSVWIAAASLMVIAGTAWLLLNSRVHKATVANDSREEAIEAKKGSRTRSILPDGTTVWLNAGSKLFYDENFTGPIRDVKLEGEAFFDVARDAKHPFVVHTSGIDIKVLGTIFNVKSYPEDKTVETTLYRGSVKVFREEESEEKAIQLRPNQKLILAKQAANEAEKLSSTEVKAPTTRELQPASFTIAHIDSTKKENERPETAWLYSRLEFRGDSFEELALKLERWYNITITFTDENVKHLSFNGSFEAETVEQAFKYLREAIPYFNYKINNHEVSVGSAQ